MMPLTLRQIEAFHAIVETGSFGGAARRLGTTQPAISKRIAELEAALGVALFDRLQRPPALTRHGHALRPLCAQMLELRRDMKLTLGDVAAYAGVLRLGITELVALSVLPDIVTRIRRVLPQVRLQTEAALADELHAGVLEGRLDLAIAPGPPPAGLHRRKVVEVALAWMCSPALKDMPARPTVADMARHPLLAQTQRSGLQALANDWLLAHGARPGLTLACNSLSALGALTVAGLGIALLPRAHFAPLVAAGELRVLEPGPELPPLDYHVLYPQSGLAAVCALAAGEIAAAAGALGTPAA